jgi:hypothetical protein
MDQLDGFGLEGNELALRTCNFGESMFDLPSL